MNGLDTREHLLDAAERLFARRGFEGTSLRSITAEAGANLASIHYHFGSKEALIRAVFSRRLEVVNRERFRLLAAAEQTAGPEGPPLEAILEAFIAPALRLRHDPGQGGRDFMCLMGRIYTQSDELSQSIMEQFNDVFHRFTAALRRALPHLPQTEIFWRFFFIIGSMAMLLTNADIIKIKTDQACDPSDVQSTLGRLVSFLATGFRAPAPNFSGETR